MSPAGTRTRRQRPVSPALPDRLEPLGRGDVYRLLALALDYPSAKVAREVEDLLHDLQASGLRDLPGSLPELACEWSAESAPDYQARFHGLFDTQGAIGYCESAWRHVDRGPVLRDVTGFYAAFGFAAAHAAGQPDSIRHQLAFMSYLAYKEWYALERGSEEDVAVTREAQVSFLTDHLGAWAGRFAARLAERAPNPVYGRVATMLGEWIGSECARLHVEVVPLPGPAAPPTDPLQGGCPAA